MIIDAHMHLPSGEPDFDSKRRRLLSDIRANGVDIGIVISDSELESSIGSMDDCAELFSDCPNVFVVAGISPYISYEPIYIDCGDLKPIFGLAAEYDIPVLFHSGWDNAQYAAPERVKAAAAANPDVRLICCHCYYPKLAECFETLKSCSNVYFDLSSVADEPEKCPSIAAVLERYIHEMPERFIFGSDYGCCYQRRHIGFIKSLDIPSDSLQGVLYGNAARIYKITP